MNFEMDINRLRNWRILNFVFYSNDDKFVFEIIKRILCWDNMFCWECCLGKKFCSNMDMRMKGVVEIIEYCYDYLKFMGLLY